MSHLLRKQSDQEWSGCMVVIHTPPPPRHLLPLNSYSPTKLSTSQSSLYLVNEAADKRNCRRESCCISIQPGSNGGIGVQGTIDEARQRQWAVPVVMGVPNTTRVSNKPGGQRGDPEKLINKRFYCLLSDGTSWEFIMNMYSHGEGSFIPGSLPPREVCPPLV